MINSEYQSNLYFKKRSDIISQLGGACVKCWSTSNLEIDHRIPENKSFNISKKLKQHGYDIDVEISKCQLLCFRCHSVKSITERGDVVTKGRDIHGTLSAYRYCKCPLCKGAKSEYMREYHRLNPRY
jgi:5-methylcytosine-specific restriction endonuclease McrA